MSRVLAIGAHDGIAANVKCQRVHACNCSMPYSTYMLSVNFSRHVVTERGIFVTRWRRKNNLLWSGEFCRHVRDITAPYNRRCQRRYSPFTVAFVNNNDERVKTDSPLNPILSARPQIHPVLSGNIKAQETKAMLDTVRKRKRVVWECAKTWIHYCIIRSRKEWGGRLYTR